MLYYVYLQVWHINESTRWLYVGRVITTPMFWPLAVPQNPKIAFSLQYYGEAPLFPSERKA